MKRCLNENEIAQYAEYLNGNNSVPAPEIFQHVETCMDCKQEILEVLEVISAL